MFNHYSNLPLLYIYWISAGKYPDTFRAVVARNPVVNNATKNMVCDNPDSMYALNGLDFDFKVHYLLFLS